MVKKRQGAEQIIINVDRSPPHTVRVAVRVVRRELPDYPLPIFYGGNGYLQNGAVRLRRDSGKGMCR